MLTAKEKASNAAASAREKASNAAASARAGMEKAKATVQEKVEKMRAKDEAEKKMAEKHKEERKQDAESTKQLAKDENAEAAATARTGMHHSTVGHGSGSTVTRTPVAAVRTISTDAPAGHETDGRTNPDSNQASTKAEP